MNLRTKYVYNQIYSFIGIDKSCLCVFTDNYVMYSQKNA